MSENGDQKITEFISITSAPIETAQKYLRRFDIDFLSEKFWLKNQVLVKNRNFSKKIKFL